MIKRLCAVVALVGAGMLSVQVASAAPPQRAVIHEPDKSVRTSSAEVRTSVTKLLGWSVGISSTAFRSRTFYSSATLADALGLASIEGNSDQKVSRQIDKNLDYNLDSADIAAVKERLAELRLTMPAYRVESIPSDEASAQKLFAFAKEMGAGLIITGTMPSSLPAVDKLAGENGINVAIECPGSPKSVMSAIDSLSPHVGVSVNFADWIAQGIRPVDGLSVIKNRLMAVNLRDRDKLGPDGHNVRLGTGVANLQKFLYEVARMEPPPQEQPTACSDCGRPYGGTRPLFIALGIDPWEVTTGAKQQLGLSRGAFMELWQAAADFEPAARPAMGYRIAQDAKLIPPTDLSRLSPAIKQKIDAALPAKALVEPKAPRKLLVVDLSPAGGFYHTSAAYGDYLIQKMGETTGAYQTIFSNDLDNLKYPKILDYDAVFLNSGDGEVFSDPNVINGLIRFVREGGGLAGLHGASFASDDIPEYGELLGATTGPHHVETGTLKIEDPNSPLTKQFASSPLTAAFGGKDFVWTDELYHFIPTGPYSRKKLHVLISIDDAKTDLSMWHVRPDKDYGLVWIKSYGAGRVFNCALGHTAELYETPATTQMLLNAIQFVLGDLPADTTPSAMLAAAK